MQARATGQGKMRASRSFIAKWLALSAAGGAAFWIADFVMAVSPVSSAYQAAFSISSLAAALVEALVGGLVIAFIVSLFLLRFSNRLPGKHAIVKALTLSFGAMILIEALSALGDPAHASVYLLLNTGMNAPRFLALGLVTGYVLDKQNGKVF